MLRKIRLALLVVVLGAALLPTTVLADSVLVVDDDAVECPDAAYSTIQDAVSAASAGDTVYVCPGTYTEQVDIGIDLVLQGAGQGQTVIESPAVLAAKFTTSGPNKPIVYVHDALDATISDLTVDGLGLGNANYRFDGIAFYNAGGRVQNTTITRIRNTPLSGTQHGVGIYAVNDDGVSRSLAVVGNTVDDYQKNGMALIGPDLYVEVINNAVVGYGPSSAIAQNGIQVNSTTGAVNGNDVTGNFWVGLTWTASGFLVNDSEVAVNNNMSSGNQTGVYVYGDGSNVSNNDITGSTWATILWGIGNRAKNNLLQASEIGAFLYGDRNFAVNNDVECTLPSGIGIYVYGSGNHVVGRNFEGCAFDVYDDGTDTLVRPNPNSIK